MSETVYSDAEIQEKLKELNGWELRDGWIRRSYSTPGWPHTLMLVNAIGYRAEAGFHHPDLNVGWANVTVKLQTHSAGGVTDKDFELAKEIESIATWAPSEGSALEGFPKKWIR
ncbi:MAG: 4a-hydroxytetrahydrobiopterin dehydratase [Planctomycetota bacterium]